MAEGGNAWARAFTGRKESGRDDEDTSDSEQSDDIHQQNRTGDKSENEREKVEGQEICSTASQISRARESDAEEHIPEIDAQHEPKESIVTSDACEDECFDKSAGSKEDEINPDDQEGNRSESISASRREVESDDNSSHGDVIQGVGTSNQIDSGLPGENA